MTFATILIVADEPQIRRVMLTTLVSEGYSVVEAKCGNDALLKLRRRRPDLILLDVNMSGIKGLDACREMRSGNEVPIIMLTEGNTEREKVMALDAGADDYLVKPFGVQELLASIRAALRRAPATENSPSFESNGLKIDFERRTVFVRGERKHLTPKEFELLCLLVKNRGKPLRHRKLLQAIWGPDYGDETEYLRVFISQLRKKIERNPSQPQFICTDPWLGYRFEPPFGAMNGD
jgi:two-component system, OmpR family, KDP operon response regulator KdpE